MPRVPTARTTTGVQLTLPDPAAALQTAQSVAGVFDAAGGLVAQFAERRNRQRAIDESNEAIAGFTRGLDELDQQVVQGDVIADITANFDTGSEALREQFGGGIRSKAGQQRFDDMSTRLVTAHRAIVGQKQFTREQVAGRAVLDDGLDAAIDSVIIAPHKLIRDENTANGLAMIDETEHLLAEEKPAAREAFLKNIDIRTITRLVDLADASKDEAEAMGHLGVAAEILKDPERTPNLSSAERTTLRRSVQAELADATARFNRGEVRALRKDIATVETPEEAAIITDKITTLLDEGAIGDPGAAQLDELLRSRLATMASAGAGAISIGVARRLGIPVDPKNRKQVDDYYKNIFLPELAGKTMEEVDDAVVELVGDINILPPTVESNLRTAANTDNPQLVAQAAQLFVELKQASPQAMRSAVVSDSTSILLENIDEAVRLNVPEAEALKREREREALSPSVLAGRQTQYREFLKEESNESWINDNVGTFDLVRPFAFDPGVDVIGPDLEGMFDSEVKRMFLKDPNIDKARTRALERVARVVGVSQVGGENRLMYLAPELMYPGFNGDSEEITRQLIEDVRAANPPEIAGLDDEALAARLIISADSDSMRENDGFQLTPGYNVSLRGPAEDDSPGPLMGIRFFPEQDEFAARQEVDAIKEAAAAHEAQQQVRRAQKTRAAAGDVAGAEGIRLREAGIFTPEAGP